MISPFLGLHILSCFLVFIALKSQPPICRQAHTGAAEQGKGICINGQRDERLNE